MNKSVVEKHLAEFETILTGLDRELNAPVLDGTPFIFVLGTENTPLAHWPVYGYLYPDQIPNGPHGSQGFRLQRGFDLCGCTCTTEARAKKYLIDLRAKFPTATYVHKRDWLRSNREQVMGALNTLKTYLRTL